MTQAEAADLLGHADHTTVVYLIDRAVRNISEQQGYDEEVFREKRGH